MILLPLNWRLTAPERARLLGVAPIPLLLVAPAGGVPELVVVPLPDSLWGEIGCAVVRPTAEAESVSLAERRAHARGRLAGDTQPRALLHVDQFPRLGPATVDRGGFRVQLRGRTPERLAG